MAHDRLMPSDVRVPESPPMAQVSISVEISAGELIDKITILEIKLARLADDAQRGNVRAELESLTAVRGAALAATPELDRLTTEIRTVNERLWRIEDDIRACDRARDFGPRFVDLARSVYRSNDERARIKRRINQLVGSRIVEEKSYQPY